MKVIITDDDESFTALVRRWLEMHDESNGVEIFVCHAMNAVWELLRNTVVDLIFLDLCMPPDAPSAVMAQIPRLLTFCPKIIVITGFPQYREECMALGCSEFLVKPFDTSTSRSFFERVAKFFREAKGPSPLERQVDHLQRMIDPPKEKEKNG
jgi:two-component SAPR family response regulator